MTVLICSEATYDLILGCNVFSIAMLLDPVTDFWKYPKKGFKFFF